MNQTVLSRKEVEKVFIDRDKIYDILSSPPPSKTRVREILDTALKLKDSHSQRLQRLLTIEDPGAIT
jgi:2-iminoacetate synthase